MSNSVTRKVLGGVCSVCLFPDLQRTGVKGLTRSQGHVGSREGPGMPGRQARARDLAL